jgi:hypothetical protein
MLAAMREPFDRARTDRRRSDPRLSAARPGARRALLLGALLGALGLACGEEVFVGRWVLRSSPADAGVTGDAGAADNPQSVNAEHARQRERARENAKPAPHDDDKRH